MTRYERLRLSSDDGVYDAPGRIVEVLEAPRGGENSITALVEVDKESTPTTFSDDTRDVDLSEPTCSGSKADDSPCTRTVENEGERCWQHPR